MERLIEFKDKGAKKTKTEIPRDEKVTVKNKIGNQEN